MMVEQYAKILTESINKIADTQCKKIVQAAKLVGKSILADGLIYIFGCGHSHILSEEAFYRAGGFACVSPIFYQPLMLHQSASLSSRMEKRSGLAQQILSECVFSQKDVLICVSTSGINGVPVEVAAQAKNEGIPVIGIASDAYLDQQPRNIYGLHLQQVWQICVDNAAPMGDACLEIEGLPVRFAPVSTITGVFILNSILAEAVAYVLQEGGVPPIYLSGNIPGGSEYNQSLINRYQDRIKYL